MSYNANDRRQIREARRMAKLNERARSVTVTAIMSSILGRQWAYEFLSQCHVFAASFNPNALSMAYNEGQRNIGLALMADIMAVCPEQYITMMREANDRDRAADARNAAIGTSDTTDADPGPDEPTDASDAERG